MDLYYYTTAETMRYILKNGDIFATNINYLNDSEEYINGLKELRNILCDKKLAPEYADKAAERLKKDDAYQSVLQESNHIYSISFSKEKDLLSQWFMYSKESGVRLKLNMPKEGLKNFKVHRKKRVIDKEPDLEIDGECKAVHYFTRIGMEDDEYEEEAKEIVKVIKNYVDCNKLSDVDAYILPIWSRYAPYIKNYEFRQENEVRLIFRSLRPDGQTPYVQYRNAGGVLIPYLDIYLEEGWPITEIMVGPGRNQQRVYTSICHFIENTNEIKTMDIQEEAAVREYIEGLRKYKMSKEECEELIKKIKEEKSGISNYRDVLYEVMNRYINEDEEPNDKMTLVQEYRNRNTYTKNGIIVRKSNAPYEF